MTHGLRTRFTVSIKISDAITTERMAMARAERKGASVVTSPFRNKKYDTAVMPKESPAEMTETNASIS